MMSKEYQVGRRWVARVDHDADLLKYLEEFAAKNQIKVGYFSAIGAAKSAAIGFYEQKEARYEVVRFDRHVEIADCIGNLSIRDGKPAVHAHITVSDIDGKAFGGHLMEGTRVFACELWVTELLGEDLVRVPDEQTKLTLWRF